MLSNAPRSSAHKKDCPRMSMFAGKKRNIAYKMGICNRPGIHPANGFTPVCRYKAIVACCFPIASSPCFSVSASISGRKTFIFAEDLKFLKVMGERQSLMMKVMMRMMIQADITYSAMRLYRGRIALRFTHPKTHHP